MRYLFAMFADVGVSTAFTSIDDPAAFVNTNVRGTVVLLEAALCHWSRLRRARHDDFRFVHVSTDEVFGTGRHAFLLRDGARHPDRNLEVQHPWHRCLRHRPLGSCGAARP